MNTDISANTNTSHEPRAKQNSLVFFFLLVQLFRHVGLIFFFSPLVFPHLGLEKTFACHHHDIIAVDFESHFLHLEQRLVV